MTPSRPLRLSPAIRDAVVAELLPDIMRWRSRSTDEEILEIERSNVAATLNVVLSGVTLDGYQIAKKLENEQGWRPDAQLVRILDEAGLQRDLIYNEQVFIWVAENSIKPKLAIGDHVDIPIYGHGKRRGIVVALKADIAQYAVSVPDLGQTFDRETGNGDYYIVDYEFLEAEQALNKAHLDQDAQEDAVEF